MVNHTCAKLKEVNKEFHRRYKESGISCSEEEYTITPSEDNTVFELDIPMYRDAHSDFDYIFVPIKYCPFCGKKLNLITIKVTEFKYDEDRRVLGVYSEGDRFYDIDEMRVMIKSGVLFLNENNVEYLFADL